MVVAGTLCGSGLIQAATTTTNLDGANSAMGKVASACLQRLTVVVGEGENCLYSGGPSVYEWPPGSGNYPADPFGESIGPLSSISYYDYSITPNAFDDVANFTSAPGDAKIRRVINGSITVDDQGNGFGADDLVSFTFTLTSPDGGDIVRLGPTGWADRFASMTQVMAARTADTVTPNAFGGLDYIIGTAGFPLLLTFTDPAANETFPGAGDGPCVGQTFGDMECNASFQVVSGDPFRDPLRWRFYDDGSMPPLTTCSDPDVNTDPPEPCWRPTDATTYFNGAVSTPPRQFAAPHIGPPGSPGLGSQEGNIGARTTGTVPSVLCNDLFGGTNRCLDSKESFNPLLTGPNNVLGALAEDPDWDQLYLKISTDARGNVLTAEGFDVQETAVFDGSVRCGSDPAPIAAACNSWSGGHFTITGVTAGPDTDQDGIVDAADNCNLIPNGPAVPDAGGNIQRDTDGDSYGNICDADLNNDTFVNSLDLGLFKLVFMAADTDADLNGDGFVNSLDLGLFKNLFFQPPGPSGLAP